MVNRELRVGATQSPEFLNLAREWNGGKYQYAFTDVSVIRPS